MDPGEKLRFVRSEVFCHLQMQKLAQRTEIPEMIGRRGAGGDRAHERSGARRPVGSAEQIGSSDEALAVLADPDGEGVGKVRMLGKKGTELALTSMPR